YPTSAARLVCLPPGSAHLRGLPSFPTRRSSDLRTLPAEERAAGFAEVVKTALVAGGELWERVRAGETDGTDTATILACVRTKLRSEEHTSELQSLRHLVCRLLLEKKKHRVATRA